MVFKCKSLGMWLLGQCDSVNLCIYNINVGFPCDGFWFCKTDITILGTDSSHIENLYIAECHGFPDLCCPLSSI